MRNLKKIKGDASFRKFYRKRDKKFTSIIVFSNKEKLKNLLIYDSVNRILIKNKIFWPEYLEKEYPKEWLEFKNTKGDMKGNSFHSATRLEGSWLYDWNPYK